MISKISFTKGHIDTIKEKYPKLDIQLIERSIFAFGLLEALSKVNLPFIFKGGTSLMLLLENPYRLSTDIDIIVKPDCDVDSYLKEVSKIYPFIRSEEQVRKGKNSIIKSHYKFFYESPSTQTEIPILLDILFEENNYERILRKKIKSKFLILEGDNLEVFVPSVESILGDKLTAFAPNTTGIEYAYINKNGQTVEKTLEVIKQFLDCAQLIKEAKNFNEVLETYKRIVLSEIEYRGITASYEDCLIDTFNAALSIFTRGSLFSDQYKHLLKGIRKIQNHIFGFDINGETAYQYACLVMLMCARLIRQVDSISIIQQEPFTDKEYKPVNRIKRLDQEAFDIAATAIRLLESKIK
ncbi:MAG: nucleotidyl transferase AbiEii/AbiGii toxin family protein [Acholeplasmataceae bacterium]|nr:nucleotidyl transferase AbiEii/AbiGii toxin family protein [Acholeplasmataceae bacterium]MDD4203972.1 nucleotidyl transferase AbiEii/AbiGii toxin family protein [Acholeplasmataceae bacterium]MDD4824385.1 nucleotidyl transferase AbiEii/AbiGii toxin family protein [Acholeplasmataceae bacterium]